VCPRACLNAVKKTKISCSARNRIRFLGRSTGSLVTILTELLQAPNLPGIMNYTGNIVRIQEAEVWTCNWNGETKTQIESGGEIS
jgi:hypothetical protein